LIIPDNRLFPYHGMDVLAYLKAAKSPRADDMPEFAAWVETASRENGINPRWLLMVAEKEQSFITRKAGGTGWQRACDWTMGFGATDSHDIPKYKGTQTQVFSAAKGLRGYLTPGAGLYVGDMVGVPFKCSDGYYAPQTIAEAAALMYTPWIRYLPDNNAVWNTLESRAIKEWQATGGQTVSKYDVVEVEKDIVDYRVAGGTWATLHGVDFVTRDKPPRSLLTAPGMCSAFQRVSHECAGQDTSCFSCCATSTGQHLKGAGKSVGAMKPGTMLVFSGGGACGICHQPVGHIALYIGRDGNGRDICAENTSSASRGTPRAAGCKISLLDEIGRGRLTGMYRNEAVAAPAAYRDRVITAKVLDVPYTAFLRGGVSYLGNPADANPMPVRVLEQGGFKVYDHIVDQDAVYVYKVG